ncbi:uncharacterized protein LOC110460132 isoform X2 [Mizuhopecten yessoensis]|uniref:uncharacterized protein LOC110460132 isoform X2 n=1 Tax=Mizuhopecten yessoensis TaxID=6573 RepID=UPI000B457CC7|nr:uncharacterized protein LOC110460132 isoform X2 [Mizuhopecten yessoensis]
MQFGNSGKGVQGGNHRNSKESLQRLFHVPSSYGGRFIEKAHHQSFQNVVADYSPSLRRYVYKNAGYRRFKKCFAIGRFGPFQDDLMVDISVELQKLNVDPSDAIEIFMPETLLQILQQKEGINRILAEYVLQGNFV